MSLIEVSVKEIDTYCDRFITPIIHTPLALALANDERFQSLVQAQRDIPDHGDNWEPEVNLIFQRADAVKAYAESYPGTPGKDDIHVAWEVVMDRLGRPTVNP